MMAAKCKQIVPNGNPKDNNVLHRIWHLPVVSSTCNGLQKMYSTTKETHPLVASVCRVYEQGLWRVVSLAAWSTKPVVQKLEPQLAAANALACRGLDQLEQKIPALNQPVGKVTSDLKESILMHSQSAIRSASGTLERALGLAAESYKRTKISPRDVAEYVQSCRVGQLAEAGVTAMISKLEKLVNFLLPKADNQSGHGPPTENKSNEISPTSAFGKMSTLAASVSQQVYQQTLQTIQRTKDKGQKLVVWIPDVGGLGRQSTAKILQLLSDIQDRTTGWLSKLGKVSDEKEEKKAGDKACKPVENGTFAQNLQAASLAIILSVRKAPSIIWNVAGQILHISSHATGSEGKETAGTESTQEQEDIEPEEKGIPYYLLGSRRSSRGHHPLFFLNLDDPLPPEQIPCRRRSNAFEAEYTKSYKSAFSPYKEGNSKRRMSEGMCRPNTEALCTRAHYRNLHSATFKKD